MFSRCAVGVVKPEDGEMEKKESTDAEDALLPSLPSTCDPPPVKKQNL